MNMQHEIGPTATLEDLYDPNFREMVRDNNPNALAALGLTAQNGDMPEIRVVTDRNDTLHISLPRELPSDLTAADLENVAAGIGWHEFWRRVGSLFRGTYLQDAYYDRYPDRRP